MTDKTKITRSLETQEKVLVKDETLGCVKEKKTRRQGQAIGLQGFRLQTNVFILRGVIQGEDEPLVTQKSDVRTTSEYAKMWSWYMEKPQLAGEDQDTGTQVKTGVAMGCTVTFSLVQFPLKQKARMSLSKKGEVSDFGT